MSQKIESLASHVEEIYLTMHKDRTAWNKNFGQWLVYGFERHLGFFQAMDLCHTIERAHNAKKNIKKTAYNFFIKLQNMESEKNIRSDQETLL